MPNVKASIPNRSVRVPLMTPARLLELRDIRRAVEGLATAEAALSADRREVAGLRQIRPPPPGAASRRRRGTAHAPSVLEPGHAQ